MNITQPTLLIDSSKVRMNIRNMKQKADRHHVLLRPHFKTHQNLEVAEIFRQEGIEKITVSSITMAKQMAEAGWNDITVAFPFNMREIEELNQFNPAIHINLLVDSMLQVRFLNKHLRQNHVVFIEIDTGYHRTGLQENDPEIAEMLLEIASSTVLQMGGFLTHAGQTYQARGKNETLEIMEESREQLVRLKQRFQRYHPGFILSYGDTPSCSMSEDFRDFDEIRPGNFVYYDVMQYHLGACSLSEIAVVVACPVVSVMKTRSEMAIYGGAVHLSKEYLAADDGFKLFGYVVRLNQAFGWTETIPGAYVYQLSQEHGLIKMPEKELALFQPGDLAGILPIHSCLTANLLKNKTVLL